MENVSPAYTSLEPQFGITPQEAKEAFEKVVVKVLELDILRAMRQHAEKMKQDMQANNQ